MLTNKLGLELCQAQFVQQQLVSKSCNSGQQPALIGGAAEAGVPHAPSLTDGCCIDIKTKMSKL